MNKRANLINNKKCHEFHPTLLIGNSDFLNAIPDIIYRIDTEGNFVYVNEAIQQLDYEPHELIGTHFSKIIHPDDYHKISRKYVLPKFHGKGTDAQHAPKLFDERRTKNRVTKDLLFRLISKKNAHCSIGELNQLNSLYGEVMASGEYLSNNKNKKKIFTGSVGIIRNVTERVLLMEKKKQLENQLNQSQKMEAIGQLAGGIAHDFNNLLGSISGYAEIMNKKFGTQNEKIKKYSSSILSAALRAAELTDKLLTFARKGNYQSVSTNIHEILIDTMDLLKHSIDDSISIHMKLNADNSVINGEPNQIQNAIINIALNAKDAMPDGGKLIFTTTNTYLSRDFLNQYATNLLSGYFFVLSIADNGFGMNKETRSRIFEPFFTTKDIGKGTGLGLSCVYGIVESHRGMVTVDSEQGNGTTFTLYFPLETE